MLKEFKPIKRPAEPMLLDVKIELRHLMHHQLQLSADEAFRECQKLVNTKKSDIVSSENAAKWLVEYENVLLKAFMEHWDLDDPPKYWTGE